MPPFRHFYAILRRALRKRQPILRDCVIALIRPLLAPRDSGELIDSGLRPEEALPMAVHSDALLVGRYPIALTSNRRIILTASISTNVFLRNLCANLTELVKSSFHRRKRINVDHACILSNAWSSGYFHWTMDDLTRLEALATFRKKTGVAVKLLVTLPMPKWQTESLTAVGFPEEDLVLWAGGSASVGTLYVPERRRTDRRSHEWLKSCASKYAGCDDSDCAHKRLYISRADANERRVVNEDQLFRVLKKRGFELVRLSELSYSDQVRLFWEADHVIGPHGAGLTNMIYARDDAILCELMPAREIRNHYELLCGRLKIQYARVLCESVGADMRVDIKQMLSLIDQLPDI
jgi:Glycosyltransferase 61